MFSPSVQVGRPAPDFFATAVVDGRLKDVSLSSYTEANHWLILIFFPKAWSFICPTEIKAFSSRLEEFLYSRSCAVVFASTDSEYCLKAWNSTSDMEGGLNGVHVPLISDCNHRISRDYGVLIEEYGVAQRALFIIDPKGIIRSITVNDADVGRSVDETLRILDALAFKDEFGEGCPVDWKKGDKGIEIATKSHVEGTVELRKSWSEWAHQAAAAAKPLRPGLLRAFSSASQRESGFGSSMTIGLNRRLNDSNDRLGEIPRSSSESPYSSNPHSPLVSPTSGYLNANGGMSAQMERVMAQHRMDNLEAARQNRDRAQSIGLAS